MTNKPMLSVGLKLNDRQECDLIRFHETCEDSQPYDVSKEGMKSLARIGLVRSLGFSRYELTDVGSAAVYKLLEFLRSKPAAQHQGEPVAYRVVFNDGEKSKWEDGMPQSQDLYDVRDGVIRGVERAYAEQPAPVAPAPQCAPCNGRGSISDDDGIDMGLCIFCDGSGAKSEVVAMPEVLRNTIHNTLRHYRMGTLSDGEGGGYPLIDAMSADGQTVSGGIEECEYLADSIFSACIAEIARLNGVNQ